MVMGSSLVVSSRLSLPGVWKTMPSMTPSAVSMRVLAEYSTCGPSHARKGSRPSNTCYKPDGDYTHHEILLVVRG